MLLVFSLSSHNSVHSAVTRRYEIWYPLQLHNAFHQFNSALIKSFVSDVQFMCLQHLLCHTTQCKTHFISFLFKKLMKIKAWLRFDQLTCVVSSLWIRMFRFCCYACSCFCYWPPMLSHVTNVVSTLINWIIQRFIANELTRRPPSHARPFRHFSMKFLYSTFSGSFGIFICSMY